jgi:nitrogen fixation protein
MSASEIANGLRTLIGSENCDDAIRAVATEIKRRGVRVDITSDDEEAEAMDPYYDTTLWVVSNRTLEIDGVTVAEWTRCAVGRYGEAGDWCVEEDTNGNDKLPDNVAVALDALKMTDEIPDVEEPALATDEEDSIDADVASAAGWRIDTEEGTAAPSEPVTVEFAIGDETIRDRGGIDEFAGLEHPFVPEACAAYRQAATSRLGDDDRATRLRAEGPVGQRRLASGWCGAHWGYSSGAIGTMAGHLTTDERAAIDAAHEAGLAAAREVIEAADAAAPRLTDYHTNEDIRAATAEEIDASADAGPEGVILLAADGSILQADDAGADEARRVYVQTND